MPDTTNHNAMTEVPRSAAGEDMVPPPQALQPSKGPARTPASQLLRGVRGAEKRDLWAMGASSPDHNRPPFSGAGVGPRKGRTGANTG